MSKPTLFSPTAESPLPCWHWMSMRGCQKRKKQHVVPSPASHTSWLQIYPGVLLHLTGSYQLHRLLLCQVCMCVCVCVYVCVCGGERCICIYIYIYIYVCVCVCVYLSLSLSLPLSRCLRQHTHHTHSLSLFVSIRFTFITSPPLTCANRVR
jgi:hypothetical protein